MKFIFLDIDGVLNSDNWRHEYFQEGYKYNPDIDIDLDFHAIERLNRLVDETGAEIVISSSWRLFFDETVMRLKRAGLKSEVTKLIEGYEFSWTGDEDEEDLPTRGDLIDNFIKKNPCENFVILDDCETMTDEQQSHFINTQWETGFTEKDLEKAIEILNS